MKFANRGFVPKFEDLTSTMNIFWKKPSLHLEYGSYICPVNVDKSLIVPISSAGPAEKLIAQTKFSPALPHPSYRKKISFLRSQLARKREMSRNEMRRFTRPQWGQSFFFDFLTARMGESYFWPRAFLVGQISKKSCFC